MARIHCNTCNTCAKVFRKFQSGAGLEPPPKSPQKPDHALDASDLDEGFG